MPKYEIFVHGDGMTGKKSAVAGTKTKEKSYGEKTASSLEKGVNGIVSYSAVKGTAEQLVTAEMGRVELKTGASEFQARLQTAYSIGSTLASTGAAITIGAVTGNLPLVLITAATQGIQWLIQGFQKQITLSLEGRLQGISIDMATRRAGENGRRQ